MLMKDSVDPDQLASGSPLFQKGYRLSQALVSKNIIFLFLNHNILCYGLEIRKLMSYGVVTQKNNHN